MIDFDFTINPVLGRTCLGPAPFHRDSLSAGEYDKIWSGDVNMTIFRSIFGIRVIFSLGIVNLVTVLMILLTCRWVPQARLTKNWMKNHTFQRFYRNFHTYIWWVFWASVTVHAIFAIGYLGWPF